MKCSYCLSLITISRKFWQEILGAGFSKGLSINQFQGFSNVVFRGGKGDPSCIDCGKKLPIDKKLSEKKDYIKCKSCGLQNPCYAAPKWLKKITGNNGDKQVTQEPLYIYGATDEEYIKKKNKGMKPVAVACVQCGGTLTITPETPRNATCQYCDTKQYLPDPLWLSLHPISTKHLWYIKWAPLVKEKK